MALLDIVGQVIAVVIACHLLGVILVLDFRALWSDRQNFRSNLSTVAPEFGLLVIVLAINGLIRDVSVELSWIIGSNITRYIFTLEGQFVAHLQSVASPPLTAYFSFVYVIGYVFLLTFPLIAYVLHSESRPLRVLLVTYILNYTLGLCCYVLFVAYGPRNFMPELVEPLLFTSWPQSQLLTSQVNVNTNVFPSLHTSLSVTVALIAYRFRDIHRQWVPIAGLLAASIAISTMYLGIHWLTDVVAGILVAAASVAVALRITAKGKSDRHQRFGVRMALSRWFENIYR